ncbi:uncharacterized protein RAG0_14719 [Rhynchosporium agropyri]|uniref:Uncharacterized protein n=1 Tax=Rhynchosporium agropyri TaxID=914238 RepID=A0A1E1LI43_9HELO|nr:uncharacterized protein RAG0_14719 [Rhynchosporium agropyri]
MAPSRSPSREIGRQSELSTPSSALLFFSQSKNTPCERFLTNYQDIAFHFQNEAEPGISEFFSIDSQMDSLIRTSQDYIRARNGYVPPLSLQSLKSDRTVSETAVWNDVKQKMDFTMGGARVHNIVRCFVA